MVPSRNICPQPETAAQKIDTTVIRGINDRVAFKYWPQRFEPHQGGSLLRTVGAGSQGTVIDGYVVAVLGSGFVSFHSGGKFIGMMGDRMAGPSRIMCPAPPLRPIS